MTRAFITLAQQYLDPDIDFDMAKEIVTIMKKENVKSIPMESFDALFSAIETRLPRIEASPNLAGSAGLLFQELLMSLTENAFPPEESGQYLDRMLDAVAPLPAKSIVQLMRVSGDLFCEKKYNQDGQPVSFKFEPERFTHLQQVIAAWTEKTLDPEPLLFLFSQGLLYAPLSRWPLLLEGFADIMAAIPESERQDFSNSANPLRQILQLGVNQYLKNQFTMPFSQYLKLLLTRQNTLNSYLPGTQDSKIQPILRTLIQNSESVDSFENALSVVKTCLSSETPPEERAATVPELIEIFWPGAGLYFGKSKQCLTTLLQPWLAAGNAPQPLVNFLACANSSGHFPIDEERNLRLIETALPVLKENPNPAFVLELPRVLENLREAFPGNYPLIADVTRMIGEFPENWQAISFRLQRHQKVMNDLRIDSDMYAEQLNETQRQSLKTEIRLIANTHIPNRFINFLMLNREQISLNVLYKLFNLIEYHDNDLGRKMLPELLATLQPFSEMIRQREPVLGKEISDQVSGALTSLYRFTTGNDGIGVINTVHGITYNNWARIGTLGLSFTRWQYDAMKRWRGMGPSEKPPLLAASGMFSATPARKSDARYHGGFVHNDPATGLSVELRRAYIVISKPDLGTLVIRNSSPLFGRDLFAEPAYFNPDQVCGNEAPLFDPFGNLEERGYLNVLGKKLNLELTQIKNQEKIKALLDLFDTAMEPYVAWKCGFKDGKPPEGFKEILQSALMSAKSDGAGTPFGKKKNIKLAWTNRFSMPFPVTTYEVNNPLHQQELSYYLDILNRRQSALSPSEYAQFMPNLLAFLRQGLSQNLELVLTE